MTDESVSTDAPAVEESNRSLSDIIDGAFAKVEAGDKEMVQPEAPEPEQKDEIELEAEQPERERDEHGRFKAKEKPEDDADELTAEEEQPDDEDGEDEQEQPLKNFKDAPGRFSPDAKEAWKDTPGSVRAEITRAVQEMEAGIEQYRKQFEPFKDFAAELQERGQDFNDVLDRYKGIERQLAEDPLRGLDTICRNMGSSLRQVAEHIVGQPADQTAGQQDQLINDLRGEIHELKRELGNVSHTVSSQTEQQVMNEIRNFAADHPRFEELRADMAMFLDTGRATDMQGAYELAERLNPAAAPAPAPKPEPKPADKPAQTRSKGQLSVSGAPASGSNPGNRKPPQSAREALDRAFAETGL